MAELTRLQEGKPKWNSAILIFAVSLGVFMATGSAQWNWKVTLGLVPILFFHELGHWLAMRTFKYKNLRMFFIPFFGAAVTGRNWNVSGWKKALVSLAGPLPGIGVGILLAIIGTIAEKAMLKQAALMLVLINGFNLLPVLPLDGGHCLHALLFCRNRWLDIIFRTIAVVSLLALSLLGLGRGMMFIGIALAVGLPVAFKMAKITDDFRKRSFAPPLPGEDRIPAGIAEELVASVKTGLPGKANNKTVAQHTLNVYETLNARPPGAFATLGLLALYGGGFFASIGCAAFLFISMKGGVADFFRAAVRQPKFSAICADTDVSRGTSAAQINGHPVNLIVSTFATGTEAKREYKAATANTPAASTITLFGSSILVKVPAADDAAREKWFDEMQRKTTNTFVTVRNNAVTMSFMFIAPSETVATNIENDWKDYFNSSVAAQLIAPWETEAASQNFEPYRKARRAWRQMNEQISRSWNDPRLKEISRQIAQADRRGARDLSQSLARQQAAKEKEIEAATRQHFAQEFKGTPLVPLIDIEARLSTLSYTNQAARAEIAKELAHELGSKKDSQSKGFGFGSVSRHGLMLQLPFVTLQNPEENLPLLMDWLCRQKCTHFKYEFSNFSFGLGDGDERD